jgi:hypothetical protein
MYSRPQGSFNQIEILFWVQVSFAQSLFTLPCPCLPPGTSCAWLAAFTGPHMSEGRAATLRPSAGAKSRSRVDVLSRSAVGCSAGSCCLERPPAAVHVFCLSGALVGASTVAL